MSKCDTAKLVHRGKLIALILSIWNKGRTPKKWSKLLLKETRKEQNIVKARREEGNNQIVITKSWEQWNGKQKNGRKVLKPKPVLWQYTHNS